MAGLLDYNPDDMRRQSLYQGLLASMPAVMAAGGRQTDPGARMRLLMQGAQGFGAGQQGYMRGAQQNLLAQAALDKERREAEAEKRWQAMMMGPGYDPNTQGTPMQVADASQPGAVGMANRMNAPLNAQMDQNPMLASLTPSQRALMPMMDRKTGQAFLAQSLGREDKDTVVAPGSTVLRGGKPVYTAPDRPDKPGEFERALSAAGMTPGTPEYQKFARDYAARKGMPPQTNVEMNLGKKREEAAITADLDRLKDMNEMNKTARGMLAKYDRLESAIRSTPEGTGAQYWPSIAQAAKRIGIDVKGGSEAEVVQAISNELAGLQRIPGSGATSDMEMGLYLQAVPRLGKTREGNLKLVDMGKRLLQRRVEEAKIARRLINTPDGLSKLDDEIDALGAVFSEKEMSDLSGAEEGWQDMGGGVRIRQKQ